MSHLPLFASSPFFPLTSQTPTTHFWSTMNIWDPMNDHTATISDRVAVSRRQSLLQQYHSSRNGEASMYNDSRITLHTLSQIPRKFEYKWLSAILSARETSVNSFQFIEKIWCCTDMTAPTEQPHLVPRVCVPVIVSRFTIFTKNFVICCYEITYFSARSTWLPVRLLQGALVIFGSQADFAISVFREVSKKCCACQIPLVSKVPDEAVHGRCLRMLHFEDEASSSSFLQLLWQIMQRSFPMESCNRSPRARLRVLRLRVVAGLARRIIYHWLMGYRCWGCTRRRAGRSIW